MLLDAVQDELLSDLVEDLNRQVGRVQVATRLTSGEVLLPR